MTGKAQVQALVAEIGPLLELGEVTAFDAEDLWTLVVDAETVLFLDYEQGQERLWLSGEVATPPPSEPPSCRSCTAARRQRCKVSPPPTRCLSAAGWETACSNRHGRR